MAIFSRVWRERYSQSITRSRKSGILSRDHKFGVTPYTVSVSQVPTFSKKWKYHNINELDLPDILVGIALSGESIYLGISTVDEMGNESDIITLSELYNFSVPPAPEDFALIGQDDFKILEQDENPIQGMQNQDTKQNDGG
jgi:hypothetical protein